MIFAQYSDSSYWQSLPNFRWGPETQSLNMPDTAIFDLARIIARVFGAFMGVLSSFLWRITMWMTEVVMGIDSVDRSARLIEDAVSQTGDIFTRPALLGAVFMGILMYLGFVALRQGFGSGGGRTELAKRLTVSLICLIILGVYVTASQNASARYEKTLKTSEEARKTLCLAYSPGNTDSGVNLPDTKAGLKAKRELLGLSAASSAPGLTYTSTNLKDEICETYSKEEELGLLPNPPFMSASYIIKTGTTLASLLGSSISEALTLAPEDMSAAIGGSGTSPLDCEHYIVELYRRAEIEAENTGSTLGVPNSLGVYQNARAISDLWLSTIYRTAARSQYGQSPHASDVYCRLLESRADISPEEQHYLTIDAAAGNDAGCNMEYIPATPGDAIRLWKWEYETAPTVGSTKKITIEDDKAITLRDCHTPDPPEPFLGKYAPHILGIPAIQGGATSAVITVNEPVSTVNAEEWPKLKAFEEENNICAAETCAGSLVRFARDVAVGKDGEWSYGNAVKTYGYGGGEQDIFNWAPILNTGNEYTTEGTDRGDRPYDDWVAVSFNWCTGDLLENYISGDDGTEELIDGVDHAGVEMHDDSILDITAPATIEVFRKYKGCLADIYYITSPEACSHSTVHAAFAKMYPLIDDDDEIIWNIGGSTVTSDGNASPRTWFVATIGEIKDFSKCLYGGQTDEIYTESSITLVREGKPDENFRYLSPLEFNNPMVRVAEYIWAVFYHGFYEPSSFEKLGSQFLNEGMDRNIGNTAFDQTRPKDSKTPYLVTVNGSHIYHPDFTGFDLYKKILGTGDGLESASLDIDDIGKDRNSNPDIRLAGELKGHSGNNDVGICSTTGECAGDADKDFDGVSDFSPFVFQQYRNAINYHHAVRLANFWAMCQPQAPSKGDIIYSYNREDPQNLQNLPHDESYYFWKVRDTFYDVKLREVSIVEGDGSNSDYDRQIEDIEKIGKSFEGIIDDKSIGHTCAYVWTNAAARDDDLGTRTAVCEFKFTGGGLPGINQANKAVCTMINNLFNTFGAGPREWVRGDITNVAPLGGGVFEILPPQVQETSTSSTNPDASTWFEDANSRNGPNGVRIFTSSFTGLLTSVAMFIILATLLAVVLGAHIMLIVGLSMLPLFLFLGIIPAKKTQSMLGKTLAYIGIAFGAKIITLLVFSIIALVLWTLMVATEPILQNIGVDGFMNLIFSVFVALMLMFLAIKGFKTVRKITRDITNVYRKDAANLSVNPKQPRSGAQLSIGRNKHLSARQGHAPPPGTKPENKQLTRTGGQGSSPKANKGAAPPSGGSSPKALPAGKGASAAAKKVV